MTRTPLRDRIEARRTGQAPRPDDPRQATSPVPSREPVWVRWVREHENSKDMTGRLP